MNRLMGKIVRIIPLSLILLVAINIACHKAERSDRNLETLHQAELPDLMQMEPKVAQQLQEEYAHLQTLVVQAEKSQTDLGHAYGRYGQHLLAYDFVQAAEPALRNAQFLLPGEVRWPYYLGYLYAIRGALPEAIEAYEQARALKEDGVAISLRLGEAYQQLGRIEDAKSVLKQVLSKAPRSAKAYFLLGQIASDEGAFEAAIRYYKTALQLQPTANQIHYVLGMAYRNSAQSQAEQELSMYHFIQRGSVEVQFPDPMLEEIGTLRRGVRLLSARGSGLLKAGRLQEAEAVYEQVVQLDTQDALAYLNLGSIRERLGKSKKAVQALVQAIELDPKLSVAHMLLGQLYSQQAQRSTAKRHYQKAIQIDPHNDEAHLGLAQLWQRDGRCREALPHFEQALVIMPGRAQAQLQRAGCYLQLSDYAKAKELLEVAHKVYPFHGGIRNALVRLLAASPNAEIRDASRALALAEQPLQGNDPIAEAEALAMAYAENGRFKEAVKWQEQVYAEVRKQDRKEYLNHIQYILERYKLGQPSRTPWIPLYAEP